MSVALSLPLKPRSLNARVRPWYSEAIATAARENHSGTFLTGPLYSRIIWFHKYRSTQGDIDNVAKRIHDALKGVLFEDDRIITHSLAIRVDATDPVQIVSDASNPDAGSTLSELLADPTRVDILYIEIGVQTDAQPRLGPVS